MSVGTPLYGTADQRTAASTTSTPSYPATKAGDQLVLWGVSGAASATTFTNPTGFVTDAQFSSAGSTLAPNVYVARKVATGSETGTLSVTHGNVVTTMGIVSISGVDPASPLDVAVVTLDDTTVQTTFTFPSQTVATDGALGLYVVSGNAVTLTATPPPGWTEGFDRSVASSRSVEVAHRGNLTTGATGSISAAPGWSGSSKVVGVLLIFRPTLPPELVMAPRN